MQDVLILCTGNSCRSQMAEALWNAFGRDRWNAVSAGSNPAGYVHPLAIRVVGEVEHRGQPLDISSYESKHVDQFTNRAFDLVVTVCDRAKETCPVFSNAKTTLHWPFDDPAEATGTDQARLAEFRRIRDEIQERITKYLDSEQVSS